MKSLTEIANYYGTDKGTLGPSWSYGSHNYTDIYEAYFSSFRLKSINILEIGIGAIGKMWDARIVHGRNIEGGASIKMWSEYFPYATIFAIDINEASYLDNNRVHTFVVDQGNPDEIRKFLKKIGNTMFDFIIDDGSHRPDHQQVSLGLLFPQLKAGGLYFIEDLDNNGIEDRAKGRHISDKVYNTRKVLRHFLENKKFLEPNILIDPTYLEKNISDIFFHAPLHRIVPLAILNRILKKRGIIVQSHLNTERLCAIRKM